jgi:2-phosphoglycerate kinase
LDPRVILIGGSSHLGKSTLARRMAAQPGWVHISTDSLARHPGRPWRPAPQAVPPHVADHYLSLGVEELIASVLTHYRGMAPMIEELVRRHADDEAMERLVLEGSALWPETVACLQAPSTQAIWLTAPGGLIAARIREESGYGSADQSGRMLIDKFIQRSLAFDEAMMAHVRRLGLAFVDVTESGDVESLAQLCLERMQPLDCPLRR